MALANNHAVDAARLLESFARVAATGGGWVAYPWRNSAASPLRQKVSLSLTLTLTLTLTLILTLILTPTPTRTLTLTLTLTLARAAT